MPDQVGRWTFRAEFSDSTPGLRGSFECVPSSLSGPLTRQGSNPIWFGTKSGKRIQVRSFHVGDRFFASNWPAEKRRAFLDWAKAQGYNTLSIASHYLNRDEEGRGRGWQTPDLWPLDFREYQKAEAILDDLARRGFYVFPFAGFLGRASDFPRDSNGREEYLKYSIARFGTYWNVLLNVGGPEPLLRRSGYLTADELDQLGRRIRELDIHGHLVSVHNQTGDDEFRNSEWADYGILQGPKTLDLKALYSGLIENHHPSRPLYAQETLWPGNSYHPRYSDTNIRKNAFVTLFAAAAINFADMNGPSSTGFSGSMELEQRVQTRHDIIRAAWDFLETIPFERMRPRPDLVTEGFCLADEGREYLVYLPYFTHSLEVKVPARKFRISWINAQRTSDVRDAGHWEPGEPLIPPAAGDDWILRLLRLNRGLEFRSK